MKAVHKANIFVRAPHHFTEAVAVANGYSDLLLAALGPAAQHARSSVCVSSLPYGAAVEVEATVELFDPALCAAA